MKNKAPLLILVDLLNFLLLLGLAFTGVLMKYILPPGSGGGRGTGYGLGRGRGGAGAETFLGMTRHDWGEWHFWLAIGMLALVTVHVLLHAGWVAAAWRKYGPGRGLRAILGRPPAATTASAHLAAGGRSPCVR